MGTYAMYRVWAGVTREALDDREGAPNHPLVDEVFNKASEKLDGSNAIVDGLRIERIFMHGRYVGIGIIVFELDWTDEIETLNLYDSSVASVASELLERLKKVFESRQFPLIPSIFHHIDLGG